MPPRLISHLAGHTLRCYHNSVCIQETSESPESKLNDQNNKPYSSNQLEINTKCMNFIKSRFEIDKFKISNKLLTTNISRLNSVARHSMAISSPKAAAWPSLFSSTDNKPSSVYCKLMISYSSSGEPEINMYLAQLGPSFTGIHLSLYIDSAAISLQTEK